MTEEQLQLYERTLRKFLTNDKLDAEETDAMLHLGWLLVLDLTEWDKPGMEPA